MASPNPSTPLPTDAQILSHITTLWASIQTRSPIYRILLSPITIVSASKGVVLARLPLSDIHVNSKGGLHGSVSATLIDWAGSLAISAWDLREKNGVSVDIHVSYVSSAKAGESLEVEGRVDRVGGTLGFTSVGIWKVDESGERGELVAKGSHTKYVKMR
ncbi:Thioesterase/thiol ester dehydrase-isomerase [Saccharata proteae CBS 121410]|uniref:Thioesterase/thiol ester dehydrase-isomerase n=1 Tax=Saccharata proteae CBS 121410 TaxID=1314787 RepID=A0A9P4LT00_9PEZI|nr:Thioesterase/thiol ester dehydrase-isomerase [Saccharata proteae CBS 121410]